MQISLWRSIATGSKPILKTNKFKTMDSAIKLSIEIEQNSPEYGYFDATVKIRDYCYGSSVIDAESIKTQIKKALGMLKGFNMLTFDVTELQCLGSHYPGKVIRSVRFLKKDGEIKKAVSHKGESFATWHDCYEKEIYNTLADIVRDANHRFLSMLQDATKTA